MSPDCDRRPVYVIAFYDMAKGPKMGSPEMFGEPVVRVSACQPCADATFKPVMKERGCMPHYLPARKGVACGRTV